MIYELEFERPITDLRNKIKELKAISKDADVDLAAEIETLEKRLEKLEVDIYDHLKPWDRVQIARHPARPTTLDYIPLLFIDFLDFLEVRYYGVVKALVAVIVDLNGRPVTFIA